MAGKAGGRPLPLSFKVPKLPKFGPMCIHQDKVPEITPIPFKLDDEEPKPSDVKVLKSKGNGVKLDLPHIHCASRARYFSTFCKAEHSQKKPRELREERAEIAIPEDAYPGCQIVKLDLGRLDALDRLQRNVKRKLGLFLNKKEVSFTINGTVVQLTRSVADIQKATIRAHNGKRPDEDPESFPWRELVGPYNWMSSSMDLSAPTLTGVRQVWKNGRNTWIQIEMSKAAQALGITTNQVLNLELMTNLASPTKLAALRESSCRAMVPDLLKMMALTAWQKGCQSKCLFYLSESQNFFIRREVQDNHASYFLKKSNEKNREKSSPNVMTPLDVKREELFKIQSQELSCFGKTQSAFEANLKKLNPEWNIVQFTKLFHHKNRFGASQNRQFQSFAIFISSLISINGSRCPFVTYQPPPRTDAGLPKQSVVETVRILMLKNRKLNEQYKGNRHRYWQMRSQHNAELTTLLASVEENWLFPWEFLLPGNIMDKAVVGSITRLLTKIEKMSDCDITPPIRGVLYKLVENYNMLQERLRNNLACFIAFLTGAPEESLSDVAMAVAQCGSAIDVLSFKRSPTILVLDQELDLIPWESMKCLKTTPVTRVPSISLIHSLTVLRKLKKEKFAEIVDPQRCGYVLNPDGSLKGVEDRLTGYFSGVSTWSGVTGRKPLQGDMESYFQTKDIYLYCGHGNGSAYFSEHRLQKVSCRAVPLLMGCGSLRYKHYGPRSLSTSILHSLFSSTSVSMVGYLYEVTDLECDRVTLELLEHWAPGARGKLPAILSFDPTAKRQRQRCLATAVLLARAGATQFMTAASLVCYGIPLVTLDI